MSVSGLLLQGHNQGVYSIEMKPDDSRRKQEVRNWINGRCHAANLVTSRSPGERQILSCPARPNRLPALSRQSCHKEGLSLYCPECTVSPSTSGVRACSRIPSALTRRSRRLTCRSVGGREATTNLTFYQFVVGSCIMTEKICHDILGFPNLFLQCVQWGQL